MPSNAGEVRDRAASRYPGDVDRYGTFSIAMHWLMLALLVAVYACIELRELFPKGSDTREALKAWHFSLGLWVLLLVWLRLIVRITEPRPAPVPTQAGWQTAGAALMHAVLYVFMIGMPIIGWLLLSAEGKTVLFFGFRLPALTAESEDAAHRWEEIHETAGEIGYFLIGLHAAAALFHHYVQRDGTLRRMLPRRFWR